MCLKHRVAGDGFSGWFQSIGFLGASSEQPEAAMRELQWSSQSESFSKCKACLMWRWRIRHLVKNFKMFGLDMIFKRHVVYAKLLIKCATDLFSIRLHWCMVRKRDATIHLPMTQFKSWFLGQGFVLVQCIICVLQYDNNIQKIASKQVKMK